jgi:hypothetical protein
MVTVSAFASGHSHLATVAHILFITQDHSALELALSEVSLFPFLDGGGQGPTQALCSASGLLHEPCAGFSGYRRLKQHVFLIQPQEVSHYICTSANVKMNYQLRS